jgi:hypothetical protein
MHSGLVGGWIWIFPAVSLALTVWWYWLHFHHRKKDRRADMKSTATKLVRECEGRRVLWIDLAWEEPEASYIAVQALRQEIRNARGALPDDVAGSAELDRMKSAAEQFCSDYERRRPLGQALERLSRSYANDSSRP